MIFVYLKKGNIIKKSEDRLQNIECDLILEADYSMNEPIIYENWKIVSYYKSEQYKIDSNKKFIEENIKKEPKIKECKPKKILSYFVQLSQKVSLLRRNIKNDQNISDDRIRTKDWWSKWWYIKPCKSGHWS